MHHLKLTFLLRRPHFCGRHLRSTEWQLRRSRKLGSSAARPLLVLGARRDTDIAAMPEAQRHGSMPIHFLQKQLGSLESSQLAQGRFIHQQIVELPCPISQVHCGENCAVVFLLRRATMRAVFLAQARLLVHFGFTFFAWPVSHIGTSHTRQPNTVQLNFNHIGRLSSHNGTRSSSGAASHNGFALAGCRTQAASSWQRASPCTGNSFATLQRQCLQGLSPRTWRTDVEPSTKAVLAVFARLCGCGNGASLHLSLQDGVIHLHHLAERDGASLLHHGLSPQLHPQLLVRFVLDVQIAFEMTWQLLFFHGDNFAYDVHSLLIQAQTLQDRKIGFGHWKNLVHLHTTGMRWCHGMELRSAISFAEVCIKMSIVWILLLYFQPWNKERFSWKQRLELPFTALLVFASHLIVHAIAIFVCHLSDQLGKVTTLVSCFDLVRLIIDALQQNSHVFGTCQGQLVQSRFQNITSGTLHAHCCSGWRILRSLQGSPQ